MRRVGKIQTSLFLQAKNDEMPEFLAKTTLYCTCVAVLFLLPLVITNWLEDNYLLATALTSVFCLSFVNIWYGSRNQYNLFLNTYIFLPLISATLLFTLSIYGSAGTYWPFMLILACYFILPSNRALIFNGLILFTFIPYAATFLEQDSALRFGIALFGTSLFAYFSMREIDKLHQILKVQAITDPLTGLFNRSLLEESLNQAIGQHHRIGVPMSLISLDIDHFKSINDNLGHDIGDVVLKRLGNLLRNRTRSADRTFRIGGEEFVILLHNTTKPQAAQIAELLRQQIESFAFIPLQNITMSFGVAELEKSMDGAQWLKASDVMLYQAKQSGRNCVVS